ncbi:hypothetical protein HYX16_06000 [Candidatus Woesearchaeota archaeon]|nr:hypothetical protein [Candidatus Woesearchaeota archaeon]
MDTLEKALINFWEKGFEKTFEYDSHIVFFKELNLSEGRIEDVIIHGLHLSPSNFNVIGHFIKGPNRYIPLEPGTYTFRIMDSIVADSPKPKKVQDDIKDRVERLIAESGINDGIKQILDEFKRSLELPEDVDLGIPKLAIAFNLLVYAKGKDFRETYEKFKLTAERLGYKID